MLEPEDESSSSESECGTELANIAGPSLENAANTPPTVFVENSSDVHIGPHLQYNGPVTVKQYITVSGKNNCLPPPEKLAHAGLQNIHTDGFQHTEIDVDVAVENSSEDLVDKKNYSWSRRRLLWGSLVLIIVICSIIALAVSLLTPEHEDVNYVSTIQLYCKEKDLKVVEGVTSVQWVVDVTAPFMPNFAWYGPNCKKIEQHDGPSKYDVYTNQWSTQTSLTIHNITLKDRGRYRLRAYARNDEEWMYFSLNVRGRDLHEDEHVVACYVAEWASRRTGLGMYTVDNIDPTLCTHLIYAFAGLNIENNTIYSLSPSYDLGYNGTTGAYKKMTSLRNKLPKLKVMLAMGGWDERMKKNYTIVMSSSERRQIFVKSVSEFLSTHEFDGLDLHWQYPAEQWGIPADKEYFVHIVRELREEFDKHGWLLTAPLGVMPDTIQRSYDVPEISKYLHYMFLLCYAYHGFWDGQTGPNAPLYPIRKGDNLNVESSILTLLKKGAPAQKMVLGLPLYGRTFTLENSSNSNAFGRTTIGPGPDGPYVQEHGFKGYNEICADLGRKPSNWIEYWDNVSHTPFATKGNEFLSYDNEKSLTEKVQMAVRKKLAGVVVWSLDTDDFRGECAFEKSGITTYPLMRVISSALLTANFEPETPCFEPS